MMHVEGLMRGGGRGAGGGCGEEENKGMQTWQS